MFKTVAIESRGAVLTTHSMEEAEILSTRIALMMKGKIVCIGSPLYLKNTYGQGYTLEIKLKRMEGASERQTALATENQLQFLVNHFPGAVLLEHVGENALFSIPIKSVAKAFAVLEDRKHFKIIRTVRRKFKLFFSALFLQ